MPNRAINLPRLFLDSADPRDWERLLPLGLFHGVTTNPLLLERAGQTCSVEHLGVLARRAGDLGAREIHLQCWGSDTEGMYTTGRRLAAVTDDLGVAIKVPATRDGFKAARRLAEAGCRLTLTAVYQPGQLLAAAACGAAYAAPYLGRLDDAGRDGLQTILTMRDILSGCEAETRLLVASLRSADQIVDLARRGLDTFTFGAALTDALLHDELTEGAAADFLRAATASRRTAT